MLIVTTGHLLQGAHGWQGKPKGSCSTRGVKLDLEGAHLTARVKGDICVVHTDGNSARSSQHFGSFCLCVSIGHRVYDIQGCSRNPHPLVSSISDSLTRYFPPKTDPTSSSRGTMLANHWHRDQSLLAEADRPACVSSLEANVVLSMESYGAIIKSVELKPTSQGFVAEQSFHIESYV